ncbi:MAG: 2,3-bisphosphoglycerate-independent phosphoglycerate mutase [Pseudomonadota bacterium]
MTHRMCLLMILDGWGIRDSSIANAVKLADTPHLNRLKNNYPHTQLLCSGEAVGLPDGVMGNSEVGHMNIGAGRVVYQDLVRINKAVREGDFFENPTLKTILSRISKNLLADRSALHLIGLVSDGGVHSDIHHLLALLDMARTNGLKQVFVHAILDGRDTPPDSGVAYIGRLKEHICRNNYGDIASICGRFYAMDRDKRWDRTEIAYRLYTEGDGFHEKDPVEAVQKAYQRGEMDEFVKPVVLTDKGDHPLGILRDGDGVICFNFRSDRVRQITHAFNDAEFPYFKRRILPKLCGYVCMTQYDETFSLPIAFAPVNLKDILGEVISRSKLRQLRIAETEKYAHVTYFFNGGEEKPFPLEDRCMVPSPREVPTYDLKPEMSARTVTEQLLTRLDETAYHLVVLNFANMDMVGHTGFLDAAIRACETVDACVGKIVEKIQAMGGAVLITADHGNAETMADENGHPYTAHTLNPVPLILVDDTRRRASLAPGVLGDIAPTILEIMGIEKPELMTGRSLIIS